jgi:hypothetical protein
MQVPALRGEALANCRMIEFYRMVYTDGFGAGVEGGRFAWLRRRLLVGFRLANERKNVPSRSDGRLQGSCFGSAKETRIVAPFQGSRTLGIPIPRALPWADL